MSDKRLQKNQSTVSLMDGNEISTNAIITIIQVIFNVLFLIFGFSLLGTLVESVVSSVFGYHPVVRAIAEIFYFLFSIAILVLANYALHKIKKPNLPEIAYIRERLLFVLETHALFEYEQDAEVKRKITRSAEFYFENDPQEGILTIYALVCGDQFTSKMRDLGEILSTAFGYPLEEQQDTPNFSKYVLRTQNPVRLDTAKTAGSNSSHRSKIDLGYGLVYDPVACPHILLAGGTGSGKTMLLSYLLIEFLKQGSSVYIADPKNADLGSLSYYLGDERVATTSNNIARVTKTVVKEMNHRYEVMKQNFKYGSNFQDHGFKPCWLLFDEMGAFSAFATDKNSKAVVSEVMDALKQTILLGRQAGIFLLISAQQMRAENLSTELRDQLGLRIALGANSKEGYAMVLGYATPEIIPPMTVKGSGLLYMQGSGKAYASYYESPFVDVNRYDFIEDLKKYI